MKLKRIKNQRKKLDKVTREIIRLIAQRKRLVLTIGRLKEKKGLPIINKGREREVLRDSVKVAKKLKVNPILTTKIMRLLIEDARKIQKR